MNVLILGAGAIGQTYGLVLARGGARVSFYVRPARREEARAGYEIHELSWRKVKSEHLTPANVVTSAEEVAAERWDQVWLTVPADALFEPWLDEILAQTGDATVVVLQPGLTSTARVASLVGGERVVAGLITFIAWYAPLPGEELPSGTALFAPPLLPVPFAGKRARAVVKAFRAGGARGREVKDLSREGAFGSALLQTIIARLETVGWSLSALLERETLREVLRTAREALGVAAAVVGSRPPLLFSLLTPLSVRLGVGVARRLLPFDLEVYLREHFTKVGEQTAAALEEMLAEGRRRDLETPRLAALADELTRARESRRLP